MSSDDPNHPAGGAPKGGLPPARGTPGASAGGFGMPGGGAAGPGGGAGGFGPPGQWPQPPGGAPGPGPQGYGPQGYGPQGYGPQGYGPQGYGPQGHGPGSPSQALVHVTPGAVQERNGILVLVLSVVTCAVYYFYWIYKTSAEIQEALADREINPTTDLVLAIFTCGLWGIFAQYRNVQKVHRALLASDPTRRDQAQTILILLALGTVLGGATTLVGMYLVQEEYNALARLHGSNRLGA